MRSRPGAPPAQFEEFQASVLFCGRCQQPRPVRERLLLVLVDGELHEYLCSACGASVGSRRAQAPTPPLLVAR
jgi:hypothetical protein